MKTKMPKPVKSNISTAFQRKEVMAHGLRACRGMKPMRAAAGFSPDNSRPVVGEGAGNFVGGSNARWSASFTPAEMEEINARIRARNAATPAGLSAVANVPGITRVDAAGQSPTYTNVPLPAPAPAAPTPPPPAMARAFPAGEDQVGRAMARAARPAVRPAVRPAAPIDTVPRVTTDISSPSVAVAPGSSPQARRMGLSAAMPSFTASTPPLYEPDARSNLLGSLGDAVAPRRIIPTSTIGIRSASGFSPEDVAPPLKTVNTMNKPEEIVGLRAAPVQPAPPVGKLAPINGRPLVLPPGPRIVNPTGTAGFVRGATGISPPEDPLFGRNRAEQERQIDTIARGGAPSAAPTSTLDTAPAASLTPGVPNLSNEDLGRLGLNAAGTKPPTFMGTLGDRVLGRFGFRSGYAVGMSPEEGGVIKAGSKENVDDVPLIVGKHERVISAKGNRALERTFGGKEELDEFLTEANDGKPPKTLKDGLRAAAGAVDPLAGELPPWRTPNAAVEPPPQPSIADRAVNAMKGAANTVKEKIAGLGAAKAPPPETSLGYDVGKAAGKAVRFARGSALTPAYLLASAHETAQTPTEEYEKRFGLAPNTSEGVVGLARDVGVRTLGAASDVVNPMNVWGYGHGHQDTSVIPGQNAGTTPVKDATKTVAAQGVESATAAVPNAPIVKGLRQPYDAPDGPHFGVNEAMTQLANIRALREPDRSQEKLPIALQNIRAGLRHAQMQADTARDVARMGGEFGLAGHEIAGQYGLMGRKSQMLYDRMMKTAEHNDQFLKNAFVKTDKDGKSVPDSEQYARFMAKFSNAIAPTGMPVHEALGRMDADTLAHYMTLHKSGQSIEEWKKTLPGHLSRLIGGGAAESDDFNDAARSGSGRFFNKHGAYGWVPRTTTGAMGWLGPVNATTMKREEAELKGLGKAQR